MCMYVYHIPAIQKTHMFICMYITFELYIYIYIYTFTYLSVRTYAHTLHTHTHIYIYIYIYKRKFTVYSLRTLHVLSLFSKFTLSTTFAYTLVLLADVFASLFAD